MIPNKMEQAGDMSSMFNVLPKWVWNGEFQAVLLIGLACVGGWVIFTWLIQMVFSVLWPFFAVVTVFGIMPSWRKVVARDFIPQNIAYLKDLANRVIQNFNGTTARS